MALYALKTAASHVAQPDVEIVGCCTDVFRDVDTCTVPQKHDLLAGVDFQSICQKLQDLDDDVVCRPAALATQENAVGRGSGNDVPFEGSCKNSMIAHIDLWQVGLQITPVCHHADVSDGTSLLPLRNGRKCRRSCWTRIYIATSTTKSERDGRFVQVDDDSSSTFLGLPR